MPGSQMPAAAGRDIWEHRSCLPCSAFSLAFAAGARTRGRWCFGERGASARGVPGLPGSPARTSRALYNGTAGTGYSHHSAEGRLPGRTTGHVRRKNKHPPGPFGPQCGKLVGFAPSRLSSLAPSCPVEYIPGLHFSHPFWLHGLIFFHDVFQELNIRFYLKTNRLSFQSAANKQAAEGPVAVSRPAPVTASRALISCQATAQ